MTAPTGPHRVRRPFAAGDRRLAVGTVVNVTGWRNAYQLVDRGYLVAADAPETDVELSACPKCGATGDDPCLTPSGKSTARHASRS